MQPIVLPIVTDCPAAFPDNPDLHSDKKRPLVTLQLNTESGQVYMLPLSANGAAKMLKALSGFRKARDDIFDALARKLDDE